MSEIVEKETALYATVHRYKYSQIFSYVTYCINNVYNIILPASTRIKPRSS